MAGGVPRLAAALWLALLATACSTVTSAPDPPALPRNAVVYLIRRDWHTEIGLRAEDADGPLASIRDRFPGVRTLLVGFGDRDYLADRRPGFGAMVIAAFPGPGALLVSGLRTTPEAAFGADEVVPMRVTDPGLRRLSAFVSNSFARDPAGRPLPLGDGPYPGSLFFASGETYALTHTCNTWTAEALQEGGTDVRAAGVLLAVQVMDQARAAMEPADDAAIQAAVERGR